MSDPCESPIIQAGEDECVPENDTTNYFKEQDEKFEELHKKLQKLKEENKRQIDAIINSLDDLMASKCIIEQTLDKVIPDDLPIETSSEKLSVVDLLSKVTGVVSDSNISSCNVNEKKDDKSKDDSDLKIDKEDKKETSDKMDCSDEKSKSNDSEEKEIQNNDNLPKDLELSDQSAASPPGNSED